MKQVYSFALLFFIVILLSSFAVVYELQPETMAHNAISGMVTKIFEPSGPKYSKYYANLNSGDLEIDIPNLDIPIRKLTMKAYSQNTKVNFIFQRVDDTSFIEKPLKGVYHYLRMEAEGIKPGSIASFSFTFDIKKSWFDAHDTNNVYLQRYHGGVWEKIRAVFEKEMNDTYVYRATTKGMSYFAITSDPAIPEREVKAPAIDEVQEDEQIDETLENESEAIVDSAEDILPEESIEEDKSPGFFSTSWEKLSGYAKRNYMMIFLIIIILGLLFTTGLNLYYNYIIKPKQDEGSGEEEVPEEDDVLRDLLKKT